jgi:CheY-like chemotaxis protein
MATILVVEDDPRVRALLVVTLEAEHRVVEATNGAGALGRLREVHPDVIVIDIAMPLADSLDVCRAARADRALDHVGIVVLSSYTSRHDVLAAGADHYLTTPFSPLALLASIDDILERRRIRPGTAIPA